MIENFYNNVGIIFIGPIIGLPASIVSVFDEFKKLGIDFEWVDIWQDQDLKKSVWKVLGLTFLPGSNKRRIEFANKYDENRLFKIISKKADMLINRGKNNIILGGMSGGFIFASRMAQVPMDANTSPYANKIQPYIKGLFGISPLVFYPKGVIRTSASLELIPSSIPAILIWGDGDTIIPEKTIAHSRKISEKMSNIKCQVIGGADVDCKDGSIRHQFFGGKDFIKPFTNIFWNPKAEVVALNAIGDFIKNINFVNS